MNWKVVFAYMVIASLFAMYREEAKMIAYVLLLFVSGVLYILLFSGRKKLVGPLSARKKEGKHV